MSGQSSFVNCSNTGKKLSLAVVVCC